MKTFILYSKLLIKDISPKDGLSHPKNRAWKITQFKHYTTDAPV